MLSIRNLQCAYIEIDCSLKWSKLFFFFFVEIWILWWYCMLMLLLKKIKRYLMIHALSLLWFTSKGYEIYSKSSPGLSYAAVSTYTLNISCSDGIDTSSEIFIVYILQNVAPSFTNLPSKPFKDFFFSFKYIQKIWDFRFQSVNTCTLM